MHPSNKVTPENVDTLFTYHPPRPGQSVRYEDLRDEAKNFAIVILANCPDCADRAAAIRLLRETVMTANASIALEEPADAQD